MLRRAFKACGPKNVGYGFDSKAYTNVAELNEEPISPEAEEVAAYARWVMEANGMRIDPSRVLVEFHTYASTGRPIDMPFSRHYDDNGEFHPKVCSVIFYVRKDATLKNGNLVIYDRIGQGDDDFRPEALYYVRAGKMVLLEGDVVHEVQPMAGHGVRQSIIVRFPRAGFI